LTKKVPGTAGGWIHLPAQSALPGLEVRTARMANHASTRTTQLHDRRRDKVSLDEVERIAI
jgi:hypothetical protein